MLDLLNAIDPYINKYWLLVLLGILIIIEIFAFAVVLVIRRFRQSEERSLSGIALDTAVVQREFTVGDEFDCSGLVVQAIYNLEPTSENIADFVALTEQELNEVKSRGELDGCYVVKPNMDEVGAKTVTVLYQDKTSAYSIDVNDCVEESYTTETVDEPTVEVDEPAEEMASELEAESEIASVTVSATEPDTVEETVEDTYLQYTVFEEESADNRLHYDRSFTARLIQADDNVKQWYTNLKNDLLAYKKVKARISWKRETFRVGRKVVARIAFRGKTMCLYLPLKAADFAETKYRVEDVSDIVANVDAPLMYRMKNARRVKYATELIAIAMKKSGVRRTQYIAKDFYMPYEGTVELINKGLIKRIIKGAADEPDFLQTDITEDNLT